MKYRSEFPRAARARIEAATLRAYDALEEDVRGMEPWRRVDPFIRCVLKVFIAFVREGCEFGKKSNHRAWTDRELDQRCRDFLLWNVVEAWEDKAKDLGIRKIFSSGGWGYSIIDDDRRRIEKSPEWKQYQELLLEAFDASARAVDCRLPQPKKAAVTAPRRDAKVRAQPPAVSKGNNEESAGQIDAPAATKAQAGDLPAGRTLAQIPEGSHIGAAKQKPQARNWKDIEISFLSDERVQITVGTQTETRNYAEMGFASKQNGTPVLAWKTLRTMAQAGGVTKVASGGMKWADVEKRMQEIRHELRHGFGLTDDPLTYTKKTRRNPEEYGYRTKFKLGCRPSYKF